MASLEGFVILNPRGNNRHLRIERLREDGTVARLASLKPGQQHTLQVPVDAVRLREQRPPVLLDAVRDSLGRWSVPARPAAA